MLMIYHLRRLRVLSYFWLLLGALGYSSEAAARSHHLPLSQAFCASSAYEHFR